MYIRVLRRVTCWVFVFMMGSVVSGCGFWGPTYGQGETAAHQILTKILHPLSDMDNFYYIPVHHPLHFPKFSFYMALPLPIFSSAMEKIDNNIIKQKLHDAYKNYYKNLLLDKPPADCL